MTLACADRSGLSTLGVDPSGEELYTCSDELVDTSVRPELPELVPSVDLEASEGDETPDTDDSSDALAGGYKGLKESRSNSNSRIMMSRSRVAAVAEFGSMFAGAVIRGRCAAHQHTQFRRRCGSFDASPASAVPGSPNPLSRNTCRFSACSSGVKAASLRYWILSRRVSAWLSDRV